MMLFQTANKLICAPIDFATASEFIDRHHRHNKRTVGHIFSLACYLNGELIGVSVCGRPVSRHLDDGNTIEINRLCVLPNKPNACSKLYAASIRYSVAKGFEKVITYTLQSENGASLKAANFILDKEMAGGIRWTGKRKHSSTEMKKRWRYQIEMKKTVSKVACSHKGKVYFKYMDGFYCGKCHDTFINGEWTNKKKKANQK